MSVAYLFDGNMDEVSEEALRASVVLLRLRGEIRLEGRLE